MSLKKLVKCVHLMGYFAVINRKEEVYLSELVWKSTQSILRETKPAELSLYDYICRIYNNVFIDTYMVNIPFLKEIIANAQ